MGEVAAAEESERPAPNGDEFEAFVGRVEPGLRRTLTAAYGAEVGRDSAVDALVWAWQHWSRVETMQNPAGYLYRVGQSSARRRMRKDNRLKVSHLEVVAPDDDAVTEPRLEQAVADLSARQRTAVVLVHGYCRRSRNPPGCRSSIPAAGSVMLF